MASAWNNGALSNAYEVIAKALSRADIEQRTDMIEAMAAIERVDNIMLVLANEGISAWGYQA